MPRAHSHHPRITMGKNYIEYNLIEYKKNDENDVANPDNFFGLWGKALPSNEASKLLNGYTAQ